jgi:hypothetical protein
MQRNLATGWHFPVAVGQLDCTSDVGRTVAVQLADVETAMRQNRLFGALKQGSEALKQLQKVGGLLGVRWGGWAARLEGGCTLGMRVWKGSWQGAAAPQKNCLNGARAWSWQRRGPASFPSSIPFVPYSMHGPTWALVDAFAIVVLCSHSPPVVPMLRPPWRA